MDEEISKVVVDKPAEVDVKKTEVVSTVTTSTEPSMAEYAARREAEIRGENFDEKKAAATETEKTAEATDKSAVSTEEQDEVSKKTTESATEEKPEKAKKGQDKRIDELTFQREEAKREAEKAKQEAKAAQEELARLRQEAEARAAAVPKVEDDPAPNRDNFDDPDAYDLAVAQFAARQELRKANEQAAAEAKKREDAAKEKAEKDRIEAANAEIQTLHKTFQERVAAAKTDIPDFDEKVSNNKDLVVRNETFWAIENSDAGPDMLYHLANNPDALKELEALLPATPGHVLPPKFLMRVGVLEEQLRVANKPKPSKAAAPIKPVGSRQSPERKTPDEETMAEYAERVNKEEAQARAARTARH